MSQLRLAYDPFRRVAHNLDQREYSLIHALTMPMFCNPVNSRDVSVCSIRLRSRTYVRQNLNVLSRTLR